MCIVRQYLLLVRYLFILYTCYCIVVIVYLLLYTYCYCISNECLQISITTHFKINYRYVHFFFAICIFQFLKCQFQCYKSFMVVVFSQRCYHHLARGPCFVFPHHSCVVCALHQSSVSLHFLNISPQPETYMIRCNMILPNLFSPKVDTSLTPVCITHMCISLKVLFKDGIFFCFSHFIMGL